jgi:hypothetical protein
MKLAIKVFVFLFLQAFAICADLVVDYKRIIDVNGHITDKRVVIFNDVEITSSVDDPIILAWYSGEQKCVFEKYHGLQAITLSPPYIEKSQCIGLIETFDKNGDIFDFNVTLYSKIHRIRNPNLNTPFADYRHVTSSELLKILRQQQRRRILEKINNIILNINIKFFIFIAHIEAN